MLRCDPRFAADPKRPAAAEYRSARRCHMLRVAERRKRASYPELTAGGPQRHLVPGSEIGGCWSDAQRLVKDPAQPPALRAAATSVWTKHWWREEHGPRMPVARASPRERAARPGARSIGRPCRSSRAERDAAALIDSGLV